MKMKTKYSKTNILPISFLAALIICGLAAFVPIVSHKVEAKISYNNYVSKLPFTACKSLSGSETDFKDQCEASYKKGAADVYFSGRKYASAQATKQCAITTDFTCTAYSAGMGDGLTILGQSGGGGGGGETTPSKPDKPNKPAKDGKTPPISQCDAIKDGDAKKQCKKDYRACNRPPYDPSFMPTCKKQAIADAKKKADDKKKGKNPGKPAKKDEGYQCGNLPDDDDNVKTKISFGCLGTAGPAGLGPVQDLLFAIIRFLSVGVGIAVTLSLIIAGIQYSTAEGNPESSQKAKLRVQQALIGLIIYIFSWSLLQYLIPGGLFNT